MNVRNRTQNRPSGTVHGVLVVDKPQGMTSHDVVSQVRRTMKTRRVGHAGTLDPMATGVLVVLLGEATKLSSILTTDCKSYDARIEFGTTTDSLDADGTVTKTMTLPDGWLTAEALENALETERHRRLQIPPQVSAIKVDGQRAYSRARNGESTDLAARDVKVHELCSHGQTEKNYLDISLTVSKGYYVRSLAKDLGETLGVPAHLSRLRRTASGNFRILDAVPWPLQENAPLLSLRTAARDSLPSLLVSQQEAVRLEQGKRLAKTDLKNPPSSSTAPLYAAFCGDRLVALVEPSDNDELRVKRGINDPETLGKAPPGATSDCT